MAMSAPTRPSAVRRLGPMAVLVAALVIVAVVATVKGRPPEGSGQEQRVAAGQGDSITAHPDLPDYFHEADDRNEADEVDWGEGCDLVTGRVRLPSVYAPPCVPAFAGANGGATSMGVTADSVKIVVYEPAPGNDITAALSGLLDPEEVQQRTRVDFIEMLADVFETYGRTLDVEVLVGSGAADDATAAVADAVKVVEEMKPFAVLEGPSLTSRFAETLAESGVLCIGCGLSVPDSVYQERAPYMWGYNPTPEQFLYNLGDFLTGRLLGRTAEYAGPELRDRERVFGVVNFDQDPPVFGDVATAALERGRLRGYVPAVRETYLLDIARLPERAATIIAKMKAAGVTTIVFLGDPLMPSNLTQAATRENYFPEWVIAGTVLTDSTAFGRRYDPTQWEHAFGVSNLAGRRPLEQQEQWRLHEWYYGESPEAELTSAVIWPYVLILMLGIHMAGPNLTPETFRAGLFNYPPSGGGPTTPQISFGDHGYFPNADYLAVDDATEIWWDGEATGPDEQGKSDAPGMWRYANGGQRYLPGRMGSGPPAVHDPEDAPTIFTELPPVDQYPDYPSPAGG